MEENKFYTPKELSELFKQLKKSTKELEFRTKTQSLLIRTMDSDITLEELCEDSETLKNTIDAYEGLIESFEEHEKVVAELKIALLSFYLPVVRKI